MASASAPTHRASLLAGLRTGGVQCFHGWYTPHCRSLCCRRSAPLDSRLCLASPAPRQLLRAIRVARPLRSRLVSSRLCRRSASQLTSLPSVADTEAAIRATRLLHPRLVSSRQPTTDVRSRRTPSVGLSLGVNGLKKRVFSGFHRGRLAPDGLDYEWK